MLSSHNLMAPQFCKYNVLFVSRKIKLDSTGPYMLFVINSSISLLVFSFFVGSSIDTTSTNPLQFDFKTIEAATDQFSERNVIGKGGFGEVYKVHINC